MKKFFTRKLSRISERLELGHDGPDVDMDRTVPMAAYLALKSLSGYFQTEVVGLENVPDGGVLLVGNHALGGVDSLALFPELYKNLRRVPRGLGLRALFDVPLFSDVLAECGIVRGDRDSAVELLRLEELVVVYPGGARDSLKGRDDKYELRWAGRRGFAHVALDAQRPIIPVAGIGPDDVFPVIADGKLKLKSLNNEPLPLFVPFARRVPFTFYLGEPIFPPAPTDDDDDDAREELAAALALQTRLALEALIQAGLEARGTA